MQILHYVCPAKLNRRNTNVGIQMYGNPMVRAEKISITTKDGGAKI